MTVTRKGMQEGSRFTGDDWVTEVVVAYRKTMEEKESSTQGLKVEKCLKYGCRGIFYE